ncbi:MAG: oligosaccharide flippase family protein [Blastocatellia bacterium]|nr:oligosaccharide flippase family protein [Blastocatellia bacterium]
MSILLIPLYTRYIVPREYGALALMMIVLSTIPLILRMGLGNALLRSWYEYEESKRPKLVGTVLIFLLLTSIPVLSVLAFFAPYFSQLLFENSNYIFHLRIICLIAFLEVVNVIPDTLMRVRNASVEYSSAQTIGFLTQLILIIVLIKFFNFGIRAILIGNLIGSLIENTIMIGLTWRQVSLGFDKIELRKMLAFGSPIIFGRLAAVCFQYIDRFFLEHYVNLRVVGLYALGNQLSTPITLLVTTPFSMIWANMQFSTMKDKDAEEYYSRMLTYVLLAASILAMPVVVLVEDVLRIFAPMKYWETATVVPWLVFGAVLDAVIPTLNVGINIKRKNLTNPLIVIMSALVNVGLNFLLIPHYSMLGAAIATAASYVFMAFLRYYISNYYMPIRYEWRRVLKIVFVSFLLFGLSRYVVIERPIYSFLAKFPFAIALPFTLYLIGFYDSKELAKASELIKKLPLYLSQPKSLPKNS